MNPSYILAGPSTIGSKLRLAGPTRLHDPKREVQASKRVGPKEDKEGKEGKKGKKQDSTQRKLSFGAGTLQLTK